ncbi:MAG: response regulator, partial [Burkholderia sp.]|nr:response regulator [Burkholderia sp.]
MDHILVVDDDPNLRTLLGDYLRAMNYRVTLAENGLQLRQALGTATVDLVVLDLML